MTHFKIHGVQDDIVLDEIVARKLDLDNPDDRWLFQKWVFGWPIRVLKRLRYPKGVV